MKKLLFLLLLIPLLFFSKVYALTYDTFNVNWYYRNQSNESNLLSVSKNNTTPFYKANNEYLNGFRISINGSYIKDVQYTITYKLNIYYDISQDQFFRTDTIERLNNYSYVNSNFKIVSNNATQTTYYCQSVGICERTFTITQLVLANANSSSVQFGVYTTNNISLGFYNSTQQINYAFIDNITIDENANSTIIDQNNQIIDGQNKLEQSIVDSNKETQDVIKDQFNSCYTNVLKNFSFNTQTKNGITITNNGNNTFTINGTASAYTAFEMQNLTLNPDSYYTLSGGINSRAIMQVIEYIDNPATQANGAITWYNTASSGKLYFVVFDGAVVNNVIIKPMLTNDNILHEYIPPQQEKCSNKIDETNNQLGNLNNNLTDSSPTDMSGLNNSAGWLPPGPVDSILTLPLSMLNSLVTNLSNNSCHTVLLELPFINETLPLPCIKSLYDKMGITGTLFTTVGLIGSAFILFNYLLALYKWVDDTLTMRENTMPGYFSDNWGGGA